MKASLFYLPSIGSRAEIEQGMAGMRPDLYQRMLKELGEQIRLGDELGYDSVSFTEHHFHIEGFELSNNPVLLDLYFALQTKRIRVGQLGIVLPAANPIRVAEDIAMLDHMTGGRANAGFARGYQRRWVDVMAQQTHGIHGALPNQHDEIDNANRLAFEENFRIVKKCWTEEMLTHDGTFWKVPAGPTPWTLDTTEKWGKGVKDGILTAVGVVPKPLQKPHPPLFQPFASSENTVRFCAKEGITPILPPMLPVYEDKLYSVYAEVAGKPRGRDVGVLRDVIIADSDEEAMALWRDSGQFSGRAWFNEKSAIGVARFQRMRRARRFPCRVGGAILAPAESSSRRIAMGMLSDEERASLSPARLTDNPTPVPTRVVSSDEFMPVPQTERQRKVEARMNALGDEYGKKNGLPRRRFFQTAAGMATAFVAMNEVYGPLYGASPAEAKSVDLAQARADGLKDQFIMDVHTHFLRDDTRLEGLVRGREAVGKAGWNPELVGKPQTIDDLKYPNWFKEVFLDSDTKVALISGSASEDPRDWFLTNEMKADARAKVNAAAGSKRLLSHAIFTPGYDGWMDEVDKCIATLKPDSWKGYTVGDNTNKDLARHPWRMDDEKLAYPFYEKIVKAGYDIVCVHKGLYPPSVEKRWPHLTPCATVDDVGKAAKDWPQIRFVIYHSAFRWTGAPGASVDGYAQFEKTGRIEWTTDLAEIPGKYGVSNVYADLGQIFAQTTVTEPRLCAALMGQLVKGLGADHVVWGTDAVWTGAPQWQIEGLRRLEIPEDMQRKYGFTALGAADGPVKRAIFGENSAKMYRYDVRKAAWRDDRFASLKTDYERRGREPSNLRYGFVVPT